MSIKVAVRVRPFNGSEIEKNAKLCIAMTDVQAIISDEMGQEKKFSFDNSFWSHDHFITDENGYLSPDPGGPYCDPNIQINILIRVENFEEGSVYYWTTEISRSKVY